MNPNEILINRYEHNKAELMKVIVQAGGAPSVLDTASFREVLITLACNEILISAEHIPTVERGEA